MYRDLNNSVNSNNNVTLAGLQWQLFFLEVDEHFTETNVLASRRGVPSVILRVCLS